jgi:UDP-N-acetylmuramoylalanine-D-glutamate ligase
LRDEILLLLEHGITVETGGHGDRTFHGQDLIVVSPGVPFDAPQLVQARNLGEAVIGEIELAAQFLPGPIVAITGANGKTTTTSLAGEIIAAESSPHWLAAISARRPSVSWIRPGPRPGRCWRYQAFNWKRSLNFVRESR